MRPWLPKLTLGLMALLCVACEVKPDTAPASLLGVWETHNEGYADQRIFIDRHRIGFGTNVTTATGYVIERVTQEPVGTRMLYVISYRGEDDGRSQLAFYYDPAHGGRITFKNRNHLTWTRKEPVS